MVYSNKFRSPLVAGFMAASLSAYSPAGHDAMYQLMLRAWFLPQWFSASIETRQPISFQSFRDSAEFWVFDSDPKIFEHRLKLLKDPFSFCLQFKKSEGKERNAPQNFSACHAAYGRDEKRKHNKNLAPI